MSYTNGIHFLKDYQRSLATLPEGTAVFTVTGAGDRPKELEAVFLDKNSATLWMATQPEPLDYKVDGFTLIRQRGSELSLLRPGVPPVDDIEAYIRKTNRLAPLPHDKQFKEIV